jgi:hypothetical protein
MGLTVIVAVIPMASNGKPHFLRNIFHNQSKGGVANAGGRFGVQDKVRTSSVRPGSRQPVRDATSTRTDATTGKDTRSQNPTVHKTQRVLLGIWVEPIDKAEVTRIAEQEGLTVSAAGAALLKQALQHNVDMQYSALLTPIIEAAIDKRLRARDSRLAWLLVRVAFDTGQTKSLVTNILGKQPGMTEETLKTVLAMSQRTAKGNITRKTPQLAELMEALEKWLAAEQEREPTN